MTQFPDNFLWGAATSAYQVEGQNLFCDWWEWEKRVGLKDLSGLACRHYELFETDFVLAKELHHNAHRLSIEWSRIEPEEEKFDAKEVEHYKKVITCLKNHQLEPLVTLHHFTNPLWFSKKGGWCNRRSKEYFLRYARYIVEALGPQVRFWMTINEPQVYLYHGYISGAWPPQEKSLFKSKQAENNLIAAHIASYWAIHEIYRRNNLADPLVSFANHMQSFVPCTSSLRDKIAVKIRNKLFNFGFLEALLKNKALDYIGINYYSRSLVELHSWWPWSFFTDTCNQNHHSLPKNSLGWDIYPQGLYDLLLKLKKYGLPVIITENGICIEDDNLRWEFIREHLKNVALAIQQGVKVAGYLYWSLIDNFEWDKGFGPRFGLIEVDYRNYCRTIRQSAKKYAQVCQSRKIE